MFKTSRIFVVKAVLRAALAPTVTVFLLIGFTLAPARIQASDSPAPGPHFCVPASDLGVADHPFAVGGHLPQEAVGCLRDSLADLGATALGLSILPRIMRVRDSDYDPLRKMPDQQPALGASP